MRAFRPRGVSIYRQVAKDIPYVCTIKSKGRSGAAIRSRLMRMTVEQRAFVLADWLIGYAATLPDISDGSVADEPRATKNGTPHALRRSKRSQAWIEKLAAERKAAA